MKSIHWSGAALIPVMLSFTWTLTPGTAYGATAESESEAVIEVSESSTSAATSEERVRLRGFTGLRYRAFPRSTSLPVETEAVLSHSLIEARYGKGEALELTLSGDFAVEQLVWNDAAYSKEPSRAAFTGHLREMYVAFLGASSELRIGQQRLAWGVLDFVKVNDVANARDLRDPLPMDDALFNLPTPLVRFDAYWDDLALELVVGWFVPDRFDLYGRRWAAIQPGAPAAVRGLATLLASVVAPNKQEQLGELLQSSEAPATLGSAVTPGVKVSSHVAGLDLAAYYQYGYDGTPNLVLAPEFAAAAAATDWSTALPSSLAPVLGLLDLGRRPYEASYVRRHHAGADLVFTLGPSALRFEAAYQSRRVFYRTDLTGFVAPAVSAALGIEYQTASTEKQLSLEALVVHVLEQPPLLIGYSRTTLQGFANFRWPVIAGFGAGLRAMLGARPWTWGVKPELYFEQGDLELALGATLLDGDSNSVGGYYSQAAMAQATAKYAF